jgi:ABC-type Fe3+ transport system substrate-binding protein
MLRKSFSTLTSGNDSLDLIFPRVYMGAILAKPGEHSMKLGSLWVGAWSLAFLLQGLWIAPGALAQSPSPALLKAKQEAQARSYIFETNRDEILANAKKEGRLRVLSGFESAVRSRMVSSFKRKYPFSDVEIDETGGGPEAAQRHILELQAGRGKKHDIVNASTDFYPQYFPFAKKFDILGMAQHGVLGIPPKMVDPKNRSVVALGSVVHAIAYNKRLIAPEKVPDKWEDFLKPEFKGGKFIVEMRPHIFAAFPACPEQGLGLEWALRFATRLRDQEPVWLRGYARAHTAMIAGEHALHSGTLYQNAVRSMEQDQTGSFQIKIIEPVPVRLSPTYVILASASNPYTALLFLEHEASPEGQEIIDKYEPLRGSIYSPGSVLAKLVERKKVCVNSFETFHHSSEWMAKAVEAFGFPKATK